jgi:DnaK suppressor protein
MTKAAAPKMTAAKKAPAPMAKAAAPKKTAAKKTAPVVAAPAIAPLAVRAAKPSAKLSPRERRIQKIRERLLAQRDELIAEAETTKQAALPEPTVFPDLGDQASAETDRNFLLRLKGREQRLIKKIEETIERIDGGNYGICDACGEEIGIARLEARPVTTMCIDCKTEQEEEEKLQSSS